MLVNKLLLFKNSCTWSGKLFTPSQASNWCTFFIVLTQRQSSRRRKNYYIRQITQQGFPRWNLRKLLKIALCCRKIDILYYWMSDIFLLFLLFLLGWYATTKKLVMLNKVRLHNNVLRMLRNFILTGTWTMLYYFA